MNFLFKRNFCACFSLDFFRRFLNNLSKAPFSQEQGCHKIGFVEKWVYLLKGNKDIFMRINL